MAHIKFKCEVTYICLSDESGNVVQDSVENLLSHPAIIASNMDPETPGLTGAELSLIGKYIISESALPSKFERFTFVPPVSGAVSLFESPDTYAGFKSNVVEILKELGFEIPNPPQ